jgi:DNA ligase-1
MKTFAVLIAALDATNKTSEKTEALSRYFRESTDQDKVWTIALLSNRRPRRLISGVRLRELAANQSGLPLWLFEETWHVVGDLAETMALLVTGKNGNWDHSLNKTMHLLREWSLLSEEEQWKCISEAWSAMQSTERFVFNKLLTGGFRMGVSQKLMTKALHLATGIEEADLAHRLMGNWDPYEINFQELVWNPKTNASLSRPFPFYLAYALDQPLQALGEANEWLAEWKWDGIRAQIILREGSLSIWSRGEELITDQFPEFQSLLKLNKIQFVMDGELVAFNQDTGIPSFQLLQTRLGRKKVSKRQLEDAPVKFIAYDCMESDLVDLRALPLTARRSLLMQHIHSINLPEMSLSPTIPFANWDELSLSRQQSRQHHAEGLMLKRASSPYLSGRKRGDWWKWKIDPLSIDAVLIYAQSGNGRRANLFTDYTFAVWDGEQLVPFTKAYSGLTDREFLEITRYVNSHTTERFGPVRAVKPSLVFEIGFEGIQASKRHKSGIALRFPRMLRWRKDKPVDEAANLSELKKLLFDFENGFV